MEKYRKKPVVIEAVQWTGKNITEVLDFMDWRNAAHDAVSGLTIRTLEGNHHASPGDFRERVKNEARQLQQNIGKLDAFINSSVQFNRLPIEECNDLRLQLAFMTEYYGVLMRRINRFG